jgi:iron complex transport system ATP-binding protein
MVDDSKSDDLTSQSFRLDRVCLQRSGRRILREISWSAQIGTCCAILGPNGSGKSTLARILAGHLFPTSGEVRVLGQHFGEADLPALRQRIRLVQAAGPYDVDPSLSARETILTGFFGTLALYDTPTEEMFEHAEHLLQRVGLTKVANQPYAILSSGERVRSLIARALAAQPDLLLLDEPTAGLDLLAREQVLATVESLFEASRSPLTAVIITHHLEELPPATSNILLLDEGAAAGSGPPAHVLRSDLLSKVYRCALEVTERHGRYSTHVHPESWNNLLEL